MHKLTYIFLVLALLAACEPKNSEEENVTSDTKSELTQEPKAENNGLLSERVETKNPIDPDAAPIEVAKAIGNFVISQTPFKFKLIPRPISQTFDYLKYVDFGRTYGSNAKGTAYAKSILTAVNDTTVTLFVSHTDACKIFLNGQVVYQKEGKRVAKLIPQERDLVLEFPLELSLTAGRNELLVKSIYQGQSGKLERKWQFMIQPEGALTYASPVKNLKLGIEGIEGVDAALWGMSNWLIIGPFDNSDLAKELPPETEFEIGEIYQNDLIWGIPRLELFADVIDPKPGYGTYDSYNYHAANLAWGMAELGRMSGEEKYVEFRSNYTDFVLRKKPYVVNQIGNLLGYRGVYHHLINTPLLDYTTAPAMPFVDRMKHDKDYDLQEQTEEWVLGTVKYALEDQERLPDGTFTRKTPEVYTTWVDDMFMGIPFLVHSSLAVKDQALQTKLANDAFKQVIGFNKQVWDPEAKLYHHAQYTERKANIAHWGRANGWGIWAASEVLKYLPAEHPDYPKVMTIYKQHVESLVSMQDESGFWHNVLDMPEAPLETSSTAIFTMAIARGITEGWLDKATYTPIAMKAWKALVTQVEADGQVHNTKMGSMSSENPAYYNNVPFVDNDSHGLLPMMFCCLEMERLVKK